MNEKLLAKIKALLAKGSDKGVTEEEGKAFMAKAAEMMAKHGLEMTDLPADSPSDGGLDINQTIKDSGRRKREYDVAVGRILQKCFNVKIVHSNDRLGKYSVWIIGTAEDREVALEVLPMLQSTMSRGFLAWQRDNGITKWCSNSARAYYYGLASGYITASEEGKARAMSQASKEQQGKYEIVLANKSEAIELWAKTNLCLKPLKAEKLEKSSTAYNSGFARGATLTLIQPKKLR